MADPFEGRKPFMILGRHWLYRATMQDHGDPWINFEGETMRFSEKIKLIQERNRNKGSK